MAWALHGTGTVRHCLACASTTTAREARRCRVAGIWRVFRIEESPGAFGARARYTCSAGITWRRVVHAAAAARGTTSTGPSTKRRRSSAMIACWSRSRCPQPRAAMRVYGVAAAAASGNAVTPAAADSNWPKSLAPVNFRCSRETTRRAIAHSQRRCICERLHERCAVSAPVSPTTACRMASCAVSDAVTYCV